jgi:hypothetical protein
MKRFNLKREQKRQRNHRKALAEVLRSTNWRAGAITVNGLERKGYFRMNGPDRFEFAEGMTKPEHHHKGNLFGVMKPDGSLTFGTVQEVEGAEQIEVTKQSQAGFEELSRRLGEGGDLVPNEAVIGASMSVKT